MKKNAFIVSVTLASILPSCVSNPAGTEVPAEVTMSKEVLLDKIKGGWAGQTIGCTYGGPTEFNYRGIMIADSIPINWPDHYIKHYYENNPWLYDDIYMDLTFVDVFDRLGLDAPVDSFALAFANADYSLWHGNQAARYNILYKGIMPPESGHWRNSPHADDIDFQIEADFAGLMSPGMPQTASEISDKIGHILAYGDGWYGGVYVANMYALAFVSDDINYIVTEALKSIPEQSLYHKVISDVIGWCRQYPDDWKQTWAEVEKHYDNDKWCPEGVYAPLNIDATINSAYIVIGLLYGQGDFFKTIDISTRCGQDSDCNPASAAGILGTMMGYSNIPERWMKNLREVEDMNFAYTDISLNKTYKMSMDQAMQLIERNGGKIDENEVSIKTQKVEPVRFEQSFPGLYPVKQVVHNDNTVSDIGTIEFEGTGIAVNGEVRSADQSYVAEIEAYLDGKLVESFKMPAAFHDRRLDIFWTYELPKGKHTLEFKWLNPAEGVSIKCPNHIIYSDQPATDNHR